MFYYLSDTKVQKERGLSQFLFEHLLRMSNRQLLFKYVGQIVHFGDDLSNHSKRDGLEIKLPDWK